MLFYRDPYYDRSPAGCLTYLILGFIIASFIIVAAVYLGIYFLMALLIIGGIVGGLGAVYALVKALPQTVKDMQITTFKGNRFVVFLKNIGYFFICITKYSIYNDFQIAKNAFLKFQSKKVLSFSKWINLAMSISVMVFGVVILLGILLAAFSAVVFIIIQLGIITLLLTGMVLVVALVYNAYISIKAAVLNWKTSFIPLAFKFKERCYFRDLVIVPQNAFSQLGKWIFLTWRESINSIVQYKAWITSRHKLLIPVSLAMIIACPVSAIIIIAAMIIISSIILALICLADAVWIIIKSLLKF